MVTISSKKFILRPLGRGDEKSLAENANDKTIFRNTSRIPHPYKMKDAKRWVDYKLLDQLLLAKVK